MSPEVAAAARQFADGEVARAERVAGGHIHESWHVTPADRPPRPDLLLQRLNTRVFTTPDALIANAVSVTRHLAGGAGPGAGAAMLELLPAADSGGFHWIDDSGAWWRAFRYIENTTSLTRAVTVRHAAETGRAFGRFHRAMARYDGAALRETLPHFHDTPRRLRDLAEAAGADRAGRARGVRAELDAIRGFASAAGRLEALRASGRLPGRIAHNDAKIGNVLFDAAAETALCVIDLDTVMPGLLLHDFGDMIRSTAATGEEDDARRGAVEVSVPCYRAILEGFLEETGDLLTAVERDHLADAALQVTLEQAARFLTDHLDGDRYYRVNRPNHNLDRAKAQLSLLGSLVAKEDELRGASAAV